jgi:Predicted 3'-5' exonuclease related to the exonuclease domain of PolB
LSITQTLEGREYPRKRRSTPRTAVVNTYRVWLRYVLFRGRLTEIGLRASEANLRDYVGSRRDAKPHLAYVLVEEEKRALGPDAGAGVPPEGEGEMFIPDTPGV